MIDFDDAFIKLTGNPPFPWQQELYHDWFSKGRIPTSCDLPTGLGKTAVVAIWLIALANHADSVPRRLVYAVNRRTVVDQTTTEVENLRASLLGAGLSASLRKLCAIPLKPDQPPLAISTLRGQFADNREWSADPARPAVIVGTVDMIGSRLLFSGYRVGFKGKPLHAAFLGQDVLLVHDEAHLEPAFQDLIVQIYKSQKCGNEFRQLRVMPLTATARGDISANEDDKFDLTSEEKDPPAQIPEPPTDPVHIVWRRLRAHKAPRFEAVDNEKKQLADRIADLALDEKLKSCGGTILVFVQAIENVERIVNKLSRENQQVRQLTGTLRGLERDRLPYDPIFARFLPVSNRPEEVSPVDGTVYLACTSAGEVGVNISGDHLVCDLTTFESMAQRFGRVNRFGDRTDTEIQIVHPVRFDNKDAYQARREKTLELLKQLKDDVSPAALSRLDAKSRQAAFAPTPTILPVSEILFDSWSMTTIRENLPGRPVVEPFLHGIAEWQPPDTYVGWRQEVGLELLDTYKPDDLLQDYPLKPHELLRDRSDRVFKHLVALAKRDSQKNVDSPVWLLSAEGGVEVFRLTDVAAKENRDRINYLTVLLPPSVGGLTRNGMLDGGSETANDVADEWFADKERSIRRRVRIWDGDPIPPGMRLIRTIDTDPNADEKPEDERPAHHLWHWYELPRSGETEGSQTASRPVSWQTHTDDVVANMTRIVEKLPLATELQAALIFAAKYHDTGKKRFLWQLDIGNPDPEIWLAKSGGRMRPRNLTAYRHEFGSLLDVDAEPDFQQLSDQMKDVVLHLIAAHHGRARPHFPVEEVFDPEPKGKDAYDVAAEVPRRFARLQRKYGRWGLAYLESLLRAADYAASANPSAFMEDLQ